MDVFHLVIDTSMLRALHFRSADFERLLMQSRMGKLRICIPQIVLEEERTSQLAKHAKIVHDIKSNSESLQRGMLGMLVEGLRTPVIQLWNPDEVERNSRSTFGKFVEANKIEVINISLEHAAKAWARYFNVDPPFNPAQERADRRKDIPDSWILEAAIEVKARKGRHCALVADNKLAHAFESEGFDIYRDVQMLLDEIEKATAVVPLRPAAVEPPPVPLDQLRSADFKDMDVMVLGLIEALGAPPKETLFDALAKAGLNRDIAEHEARTLVLSGRLLDTGSHLLPTNRALAKQAAETEAAVNVLLRIL
jgi:predicted nucleic acid-binding protein